MSRRLKGLKAPCARSSDRHRERAGSRPVLGASLEIALESRIDRGLVGTSRRNSSFRRVGTATEQPRTVLNAICPTISMVVGRRVLLVDEGNDSQS